MSKLAIKKVESEADWSSRKCWRRHKRNCHWDTHKGCTTVCRMAERRRRGNTATSNNTPRTIIIQFGMRTVWDNVWKRSRDARVCSEMHIHLREDFPKEDLEAHTKLWPLVQKARRKGKRAFLTEGYALIDN